MQSNILSLEGLEGKFQRTVHSLEMERECMSALKEEIVCQAVVADRMVVERACLLSDISILHLEKDRQKAKLTDVELIYMCWKRIVATYIWENGYKVK